MNSHLFVCLQHVAKEREQKGSGKPGRGKRYKESPRNPTDTFNPKATQGIHPSKDQSHTGRFQKGLQAIILCGKMPIEEFFPD